MNRKYLIKAYKNTVKQTFVLFTLIYLFRSFVVFEFRNPFEWFINIPNLKEHERGIILFSYLTYVAVSVAARHEAYRMKECKEKEEQELLQIAEKLKPYQNPITGKAKRTS